MPSGTDVQLPDFFVLHSTSVLNISFNEFISSPFLSRTHTHKHTHVTRTNPLTVFREMVVVLNDSVQFTLINVPA
jgi:hypothetical protein